MGAGQERTAPTPSGELSWARSRRRPAPPKRWARTLRQDLQAHLHGERIAHRPAVTADRGRRRLEGVLIVDYTDAPAVRFAAHLHLQPYLTVWRTRDGRSVLEVIDLDQWQQEQVVAAGQASLGRLEHRPCPMIPGAGRTDLCRMHGGPWTSGSISATASWERKRDRMLRGLGCDTCGDGAIKVFPGRRIIDGVRSTRDVRPRPGPQTRHGEIVYARARRRQIRGGGGSAPARGSVPRAAEEPAQQTATGPVVAR